MPRSGAFSSTITPVSYDRSWTGIVLEWLAHDPLLSPALRQQLTQLGQQHAFPPRILFIPRFQQATTAPAYHLLELELVAQLHDTHAFLYGSAVLSAQFGDYYPPLKLTQLEGQVVVTQVYREATPTALPVQVGDMCCKPMAWPCSRFWPATSSTWRPPRRRPCSAICCALSCAGKHKTRWC
ncbi:hypothetical protein [Hymenobacter crusticola]|uniref:hypothetical protein n=1 Tax=Hymenobacter crusticola TaxID=1770526 RepID=UPI00117ACC5E|nr:hypothetical protein [Hymenobacter crusticola]